MNKCTSRIAPALQATLQLKLVARAEPDGHTLLLSTFTHPVNETLFKNFKYKAVDSFEPIAAMVETGLVSAGASLA